MKVMDTLNKEEAYTNFLECIIKATNTEVLYSDALKCILNLFTIDRVQIWEKINNTNELSVLFEEANDTESSMLKFRLPLLQNNLRKNIQSEVIWEYTSITDSTLNKFNINSLTGINIQLPEKSECILILASKGKNKKLTRDEINLLVKIKIQLEAEINKLKQFEKNKNEAERLQSHNIKLREHDRLRTNFINNISHEFRTPLASIVGFSKMLTSKQNLSDSIKEIAEQIHHAANRLSLLITDFLEINKSSTESWSAHIEPCDMGEIIKDAVEEFHSLNKDHKISYVVSDNYPILKTDPHLVRQVLDNLIINAIKYSSKGSKIIVSLDIPPNNKIVKISVTDQGMGIDKNELSKVFNRLYRSPNPEIQRIAGSGLGLSICKEIITILNGNIEVESELNKGSKFSFSLPTN